MGKHPTGLPPRPDPRMVRSKYLRLTTNEERDRWATEHVHVPATRMGKPAEIASLIEYLCSNLAGYITGNWIEVDAASTALLSGRASSNSSDHRRRIAVIAGSYGSGP